jgi:hypothetical protein
MFVGAKARIAANSTHTPAGTPADALADAIPIDIVCPLTMLLSYTACDGLCHRIAPTLEAQPCSHDNY